MSASVTTTTVTSTDQTNAAAALRDPARIDRIKYQNKLRELEALFKVHHQFGDEMTKRIKLWHQLFSHNINSNPNVQQVANKFLTLLEQLLVNPIVQTPIDDAPILGSDGRTYGTQFITLLLVQHQKTTEGLAKWRSPLSPDIDVPFSCKEHTIVKHMITEWLQKYQHYRVSESEQKSYQALVQSRSAPALLTETIAMTQYAAARNLERKSQAQETESKESKNEFKEPEDFLKKYLAEKMAAAQKAIQESQNRTLTKIKSLEERDKERRERIEKALKEAKAEIASMDQEIKILQEEIAKLRGGVEGSKLEQLELDINVKRFEKEMKERKSSWMNVVLSIAVSTVIMIVAKEYMLVSAGNNGFMVFGKIPF